MKIEEMIENISSKKDYQNFKADLVSHYKNFMIEEKKSKLDIDENHSFFEKIHNKLTSLCFDVQNPKIQEWLSENEKTSSVFYFKNLNLKETNPALFESMQIQENIKNATRFALNNIAGIPNTKDFVSNVGFYERETFDLRTISEECLNIHAASKVSKPKM